MDNVFWLRCNYLFYAADALRYNFMKNFSISRRSDLLPDKYSILLNNCLFNLLVSFCSFSISCHMDFHRLGIHNCFFIVSEKIKDADDDVCVFSFSAALGLFFQCSVLALTIALIIWVILCGGFLLYVVALFPLPF